MKLLLETSMEVHFHLVINKRFPHGNYDFKDLLFYEAKYSPTFNSVIFILKCDSEINI